ncbi:MAG: hypothetical protein H5U33_22460, partial [Pseudomonas sp.]|nr:hypothetical protein [Pseudomonas sp.]
MQSKPDQSVRQLPSICSRPPWPSRRSSPLGPAWLALNITSEGRLVEVLGDFSAGPVALQIVYPP